MHLGGEIERRASEASHENECQGMAVHYARLHNGSASRLCPSIFCSYLRINAWRKFPPGIVAFCNKMASV